MFSFPETVEELEEFSLGFFEAYKEQDISAGDFQQESSTPQIPTDMMMFYRDQVTVDDGYWAFNQHQMTQPGKQINYHGQKTSCLGETVFRDQTEILSHKHPFHGYQTSNYRGNQNLYVDPQMTRPFGGQPLYDRQMQTFRFDTIHHGNKIKFNEECNMFQEFGPTGNYEDTVSLGMRTNPGEMNIFPDQKKLPNVERSHRPQMTTFGDQTLSLGQSTSPSSCVVVDGPSLESFSAPPSVQGGLPQEKSDMKTQSQVTRTKSLPLKPYYCPVPDCGKIYKKRLHLNHHMKKHTGEKPYVCNEPGCSWKFTRPEDLKRHKTKHSGERPHPCDKCNKRFSRLYYLKQHQKVCKHI
ncbi:zinc finger protein 352 [Sigmodon hispidus]